MELKKHSGSTAFSKGGVWCRRSRPFKERLKLIIIRSFGEKWLQIKKSCGSSSLASFTFSTNCPSFALLLYHAAVPLLKSPSNRSIYPEYRHLHFACLYLILMLKATESTELMQV